MHAREKPDTGSSDADPIGVPVLKQLPAGWTIQLLDASGVNVLNLPVFPSRFLAEEALLRIRSRQADPDSSH